MESPVNAITRLEDFIAGHKARACDIERGDGYGATCWCMTLRTEKGTIRVAEVGFFPGTLKPDCYFVANGDDPDFDWPGLEAVINLALDRAEEKCNP